jgi:hypothetical protein
MAWYTEGVVSSPSANDLLADTGQLSVGGRTIQSMVLAANVSATIRLEHRNAANDTTLNSQTFYLSALAPVTFQPNVGVTVSANDRFRIVVVSGLIVGNVQASLFVI